MTKTKLNLEKGKIYILSHTDITNVNIRVKSLCMVKGNEHGVIHVDLAVPDGKVMPRVALPEEHVFDSMNIPMDDLEFSGAPGAARKSITLDGGIKRFEKPQSYFARFAVGFIQSQGVEALWNANQ